MRYGPLTTSEEAYNDICEELKLLNRAIARLDEAMATPEKIEEDTRLVGGFVSGLDLVETAEQIIERAIVRIKG